MKNIKKFVAVSLCILLNISLFVPLFTASASSMSRAQVKNEIDSIITFKQKAEGASSLQALVNNVFPGQAGAGAEWYVLSLSQYDSSLDFSKYREALEKFVASDNSSNATEKEKYALLLALTGYSGAYITDTISSSTGKLGIMSYIYSLHLLNLGFSVSDVSKQSVIDELLSRQLSDGGFAISGKYGDVDVTAMTLQALSQNTSDKAVKAAVEKALTFLSGRLDENCEYSSYGAVNSESTSQVIIALGALGIDACANKAFIKGGKTLIDTLASYKQADNGYSHVREKGTDAHATVQALMAFVAYYRFLSSKGSIYKFPVKLPSIPDTTRPTTMKPSVSSTASSEKTTRPSTTQKPSNSTTQPLTTRPSVAQTTPSSAGGGNGGLFGSLDIFGLFSTAKPETTSQSSASPAPIPQSEDTQINTSADSLTSLSESVTQTEASSGISSESCPDETVTESSSEYAVSQSETSDIFSETTLFNDSTDEKHIQPLIPAIVISLVVLIAVTGVVLYKRRH